MALSDETAVEEAFADLEKVYCGDLKVGMYVQELDRPWLETPFMFQGFCIRTIEEIEELQKYCSYVLISRTFTEAEANYSQRFLSGKSNTELHVREIARRTDHVERYPDAVGVEKELDTARGIYDQSAGALENLFRQAHSSGSVKLADASSTTADIVGSVLRNPDAFMLLRRLREKGSYRYTHAVNCCALAATFCRHLGFDREEILDISLGALLLDIGVIRLPDSLLKTEGKLNPSLIKLIHYHVEYGMDILGNSQNLPKIVKNMVLTHHERVNGKGYPNALKGDEIPVCGRIAAIVDCYDALISSRPYRSKISPSEALCSMYARRNIDFHEDLMEQFIQCIGAYPTGSVVELSNGHIGIVMSQNRVRRLYPRVLLIQNADGIRYESPKTIDMWDYARKTRGEALEIRKVVDAEGLGIDLSDYYL